jgi:hypothetical protein
VSDRAGALRAHRTQKDARDLLCGNGRFDRRRNFAIFSLWLPEQFETRVRATAFACCTSFGRFVGAGVNFLLGAAVLHLHTLGLPVALTAVAFVIGLFVIPLAPETRGEALPQ